MPPHVEAAMCVAGDILTQRMFDLQTIQSHCGDNNEAWWIQYDIEPGLGHTLVRHVSKYGHYRQQRQQG